MTRVSSSAIEQIKSAKESKNVFRRVQVCSVGIAFRQTDFDYTNLQTAFLVSSDGWHVGELHTIIPPVHALRKESSPPKVIDQT